MSYASDVLGYCDATHPDNEREDFGHWCTREPGHEGDHCSYGVVTWADLDRSEEAVPAEADSTDYDHLCIRTLGCETGRDRHARACQRANDQARAEHYRGLFEEYQGPAANGANVVDVVGWHVAHSRGEATVWVDEVIR